MNKELILRENLAIQRTNMANQTTLLSFIRTSMYFLVAGLSIQNVGHLAHLAWVYLIFYVFSGALLVIGIWNYFRQRQQIRLAHHLVGDAEKAYRQPGF